MKKLWEYFVSQPHRMLSIPTVLGFLGFLTNLFTFLRDGNLDNNEFQTLLSTADSFQTVILFVIMLVMRSRK